MSGFNSRCAPSTTSRKANRVVGPAFLSYRGKSLWECGHGSGVMAQIANSLSALAHQQIGAVHRVFHDLSRLLMFWQQPIDNLEAQHQAVKTLQQSVVQLARDALPLAEALRESRLDL